MPLGAKGPSPQVAEWHQPVDMRFNISLGVLLQLGTQTGAQLAGLLSRSLN